MPEKKSEGKKQIRWSFRWLTCSWKDEKLMNHIWQKLMTKNFARKKSRKTYLRSNLCRFFLMHFRGSVVSFLVSLFLLAMPRSNTTCKSTSWLRATPSQSFIHIFSGWMALIHENLHVINSHSPWMLLFPEQNFGTKDHSTKTQKLNSTCKSPNPKIKTPPSATSRRFVNFWLVHKQKQLFTTMKNVFICFLSSHGHPVDGCHGYHVVKLNSAGPSKHYSYTLEVPVDYLVDSCFSIRIYFINKSRVDYSAVYRSTSQNFTQNKI